MSSASSPLHDESEIQRLSDDPADDDPNAAATKVGPMSKAFVDQMMFKAQLAESRMPPSRPPDVERPPVSSTRPRSTRSGAPAPLSEVPTSAAAAPPQREVVADETAVVEATLPIAIATPATPAAAISGAASVPAQRTEAGTAVHREGQPGERFVLQVALVLAAVTAAIATVVHFLFP